MTGGDIPIGDFTYPVTSDMSAAGAGQFNAVYLNGTTLALATNATQKMLGILQDNPNGATKATVGAVRELGHSKCWVDTSNILAGSALKLGASGGVLTLSSGGSSDVIVAIATETNNSTACIIEVALTNRVAEGGTTRAGQITVSVPFVKLGVTTGLAAMTVPIGFSGTVTGMYATPTVAATTSGATTLSLKVNSTVVAGLSCVVGASPTLGVPIAQTGTVSSGGAFITPATDTLTIYSTPTVSYAGDTGVLEVHILYN